jgi:hypothetical protein
MLQFSMNFNMPTAYQAAAMNQFAASGMLQPVGGFNMGSAGLASAFGLTNAGGVQQVGGVSPMELLLLRLLLARQGNGAAGTALEDNSPEAQFRQLMASLAEMNRSLGQTQQMRKDVEDGLKAMENLGKRIKALEDANKINMKEN